MRAEGFTRWDAFLQLNFHPRKQVNPLMTQEQEQQLSQTMLAMMQSGGDAPKSTVEVPVYAWRLIRWEADVPLTEEQRQEALAIVPEAMALCGVRVSEQKLFLSSIQEVHRDDAGGISGDGEGKVIPYI